MPAGLLKTDRQRAVVLPIAQALAVASAVFVLAAGGLLVFSQVQGKVRGLVTSGERDRLVAELRQRPRDQALKEQIWQLDLELREKTFRQLRLSHNAARALIGGLVVFLASGHLVRIARQRLPDPLAWGAHQPDQVPRVSRAARYAVAAAGLLVMATALLVSTRPANLPARPSAGDAAFVPVQWVDTLPTMEEWQRHWPGFRGPWGDGVTDTRIDFKVRWKTAVPLPGMSSPVIWSNSVFLTGATGVDRRLFRFDTESGQLSWSAAIQLPVGPGPAPSVDQDTGLAAPTAVTDGRRVYAIFAGGEVGAFDFQGKQAWARHLGPLVNAYGYSSSLALWRDRLMVQLDLGSEENGISRLLALNTRDGRPAWETWRPTGGSWASPVLAKAGERLQLLTCGDPFVLAYDPATGTELWRFEGMASELAPSPIGAGGLVIACQPHTHVLAIRPDGQGEVTDSHRAWKITDGVPDVPSPTSDGRRLYLLTSEGLLTCAELATGRTLWTHQFEGEFYASPSVTGSGLLVISRDGVMVLAALADEYRELGKHELGEPCHTSPGFYGGRMYVRGQQHLFCIGE